ncbi:MAG: glycosyl transferase family protein [Microgenomates group bacterium GW2011_GWC1_44_10]|nr:MAG: glycosyl transferase family protein [Microgenomates group bacterium GW2011_GWC1_44_10]
MDYYIIDNSPLPEVERGFKKNFPNIHYVSSPANPGFAAGNNLAIRQALKAGSTHILIINPDAAVGRNFFRPLLKHFSDKKVGIVAPVIYHEQKRRKIYGLEGKVDWKYAKPEHRNLYSLKKLEPIVSDFVTFACVLISADTFRRVGLLDEGYFMYFEDVDYCLSAGRRGKKIILDPSVVVAHNTSSSFKRPTQKLFISFKSHLRFINKWLPPTKRLIPYLYALSLYPYLYLLWSYHYLKYAKHR